MSTISKIYELLMGNEDDDGILIKREPIKSKYNYKVSEYEALSIAKEELTKVYIKNYRDSLITYISLYLKIDKVLKINNKEYYYIKATGGEISGIDGDTLWDGEITKNGADKLKCLVDVNIGKYKYVDSDIASKL